MEVQLRNALSTVTLEVGQTVSSQHVRVFNRLISLEVEKSLPPVDQVPLQLDQSADILVMGSHVVQKRDCLLALHAGLNGLVADVESVLSKPIENESESKYEAKLTCLGPV